MPSILPEMSIEESLDVTRIYSVADQLPAGTPLIRHRPFRAPHHTISHAGLVGGGNIPEPGEISLAHRGVLFLDEFLEFGMRVLEVMRQPMEDKVVTISRAKGSLTFSANFQLIAAMSQLNLSARGYHRILKLARTIADLAGCEEIQSSHLAEALQYRPKLMLN
jgi:magnesium chelatase family protein